MLQSLFVYYQKPQTALKLLPTARVWFWFLNEIYFKASISAPASAPQVDKWQNGTYKQLPAVSAQKILIIYLDCNFIKCL